MVSYLDLGIFILLYSFLGWCLEACICSLVHKRFVNRGFLSLPFNLHYGFSAGVLLVMLPTLDGRPVAQVVVTAAVVAVGSSISGHLMNRLAAKLQLRLDPYRGLNGSLSGAGLLAVTTAGYYLIYLVFQPLLTGLMTILPSLVKKFLFFPLALVLAADWVVVLLAVRQGNTAAYREFQEKSEQLRLFQRLSKGIWRRLQKAYPDIQPGDEASEEKYVFAKGFCLDKILWIFLVSSLLGDLIETVYCGVLGNWMSRSSVLYGPFSFVWGIGAVLLTLSLHQLAEKGDRYVFLGGCIIGGVYEYMCSLFTEIVFGTVFWDYSEMPFNIGGRTNLLYCFFWGILSVVWVRNIYPVMSRQIEKLPPVAGKVLTWVLVAFMICNALLTSCAMLRYRSRAVTPQPANQVEQLLDQRFPDEYMEKRWPNMTRS